VPLITSFPSSIGIVGIFFALQLEKVGFAGYFKKQINGFFLKQSLF